MGWKIKNLFVTAVVNLILNYLGKLYSTLALLKLIFLFTSRGNEEQPANISRSWQRVTSSYINEKKSLTIEMKKELSTLPSLLMQVS